MTFCYTLEAKLQYPSKKKFLLPFLALALCSPKDGMARIFIFISTFWKR